MSVPAVSGADTSRERPARPAASSLASLNGQVERERERVAALATRSRDVEQELAATRRHLAIAGRALARSRARLAGLARALYEDEGVHPLSVFLAARSLDDALSALDSVERAALGE